MEASDEENDEVIAPVKRTPAAVESDDDGCEFDDIDEADSMRQASDNAAGVPKETLSPARAECNDGDVDMDGIRTSIGNRPKVKDVMSGINREAPSALLEEREARESVLNKHAYGGGGDADDDPDVVLDEEAYNTSKPIVRDLGKSKPCYRVPFKACAHMPFVTEMSEAIQPYTMTAERYTDQTGKNGEITKEIIQSLTPAKLAQQVAVFHVYKGQSTANSLRRYAAFIRVKVIDFDEGNSSLKHTLDEGQALYQPNDKEFTKLSKGDHGIKLPRSLVPASKAVEYVRLVPKLEAEERPEGWIVCPSVGDGKPASKRAPKVDKEKAAKKKKLSDSVDTPLDTPLDPQGTCAAPTALEPSIAPSGDSTAITPSVYQSYTFVPQPDTGGVPDGDGGRGVCARAAPPSSAASRLPVNPNGNGSMADAAEWRSESYKFDLQGYASWPTVGPSFDFDPMYSAIEVSFKIFKKH